jgi:uncharacterized protein (TIGR03437 family)
MRSVFLFAWALVPAFAQFGSLATNHDGSRVYFVSNLRQTGTNQPPWGKVFVADAAGIWPLAIRNRDVNWVSPSGYITNPFNLTAVAIAHDESRLALLGGPDCNYGSPCSLIDLSQTDIYDSTGQDTLTIPGRRANISPNGRWALMSEKTPVGILATSTIDLTTGQSSTFDWWKNRWSPLAIADEGTTALVDANNLYLIRPDGSSSTIPANAVAGAFDSRASTLVWADSRTGLQVPNTSTLTQRVLFASGDSYPPEISDDGQRVLFVSSASTEGSPQVFVVGADGSGLRQISHEAAGIQSAALSGDGSIAWVLSGDGSVLRLRIDSAGREQIIGPSVDIPLPFRTILDAAPGEPVLVTGKRLAPQGGSVQARRGSVSLPLLSADERSVTFQVPWEAALDPAYDVEFTIPGRQDPAWIPVVRLNIVSAAPQFVLPAIHEGFTSVITMASPARPGEVITLYAIGLGAVAPAVATGQAAPLSPVSYLVDGLVCSAPAITGQFIPMDVLFTGLAPATIGYYQVNLRLPASLPDSQNFQIQCGQLLKTSLGSYVQENVFVALIPVSP